MRSSHLFRVQGCCSASRIYRPGATAAGNLYPPPSAGAVACAARKVPVTAGNSPKLLLAGIRDRLGIDDRSRLRLDLCPDGGQALLDRVADAGTGEVLPEPGKCRRGGQGRAHGHTAKTLRLSRAAITRSLPRRPPWNHDP